ncbi:hypothetical protein APR09_000918 [Nocardia amikacinitolerans]|nr:hypothetical protein [Nocardia amikacinitolerans]
MSAPRWSECSRSRQASLRSAAATSVGFGWPRTPIRHARACRTIRGVERQGLRGVTRYRDLPDAGRGAAFPAHRRATSGDAGVHHSVDSEAGAADWRAVVRTNQSERAAHPGRRPTAAGSATGLPGARGQLAARQAGSPPQDHRAAGRLVAVQHRHTARLLGRIPHATRNAHCASAAPPSSIRSVHCAEGISMHWSCGCRSRNPTSPSVRCCSPTIASWPSARITNWRIRRRCRSRCWRTSGMPQPPTCRSTGNRHTCRSSRLAADRSSAYTR